MGIFQVCPSNLRMGTVAAAGRNGGRTLGPARPRSTLRAQHVPAEPIQRRSTRCSAVLPTQAYELSVAINELCIRCF
eukprot:2196164-Alexandrium_andersonii.AAC.1